LDAGKIRLEPGPTKNRDGRTFPFRALPPLVEFLEELRERIRAYERRMGRIIPRVFHYRGQRLQSIRRAWAATCKAEGMPDAWFHDLRRFAVRNMERAGVSSVAMKLSGHQTESVYRCYAIADSAALEEGVGKLASLHSVDRPRRHAGRVLPMGRAEEAWGLCSLLHGTVAAQSTCDVSERLTALRRKRLHTKGL
jgi:integrase